MKHRLTKIYTRSGDKGMTGLAGGIRVRKDSPRVEAYGATDELNAIIGLTRAYLEKEKMPPGVRKELDGFLKRVQHELFNMGGDLARPLKKGQERNSMITDQHVKDLEERIDKWQKDLKPLKEFILRGGGIIPSWLHFACTVARRAERVLVTLINEEDVDPSNLKYLNRLNDALFVLARWTSIKMKKKEILWEWHTLGT